MAAIEHRGFTPDSLAGTSAGSIVAACRAAGYVPEELRQIMMDLDFRTFKDGGRWGRKIYNLLRYKGIYRGDVFYRTMQGLMKEKGLLTFGDLRNEEESNPRYRYRLRVFASDIVRGTLVTWPDDAALYGLDPDYLEVAWAVRTSMSIPYFFQPVRINGSYLVDGGLLSNFPIWFFDSHTTPEWPTFGVMLEGDGDREETEIRGPVSFLEAMFQTVMSAHDRRFIRPGDFAHRTIKVNTGSVKATDFNMNNAAKEKLYHSGFRAGLQFFDGWRWDEYVEWARKTRGVIAA
jgi:NTE family protein